MDSVLTSIKKMLGIDEAYECFDPDIIMNINMALNVLSQLGVKFKQKHSIEDDTTTWDDLIVDIEKIQMVKTYVYLKTRLVFDPPASATTANSYQSQISELEWRINVQVDPEEGNVLC